MGARWGHASNRGCQARLCQRDWVDPPNELTKLLDRPPGLVRGELQGFVHGRRQVPVSRDALERQQDRDEPLLSAVMEVSLDSLPLAISCPDEPDQFPTAGSGMNSSTPWAQRQAVAVLAAHSSASSREGTSTTQKPPMASG
jgi:hypothetical protein